MSFYSRNYQKDFLDNFIKTFINYYKDPSKNKFSFDNTNKILPCRITYSGPTGIGKTDMMAELIVKDLKNELLGKLDPITDCEQFQFIKRISNFDISVIVAPTIALVSQNAHRILDHLKNYHNTEVEYVLVCSSSENKSDDYGNISTLTYSTKANEIYNDIYSKIQKLKVSKNNKKLIILSTYKSFPVLIDVLNALKTGIFNTYAYTTNEYIGGKVNKNLKTSTICNKIDDFHITNFIADESHNCCSEMNNSIIEYFITETNLILCSSYWSATFYENSDNMKYENGKVGMNYENIFGTPDTRIVTTYKEVMEGGFISKICLVQSDTNNTLTKDDFDNYIVTNIDNKISEIKKLLIADKNLQRHYKNVENLLNEETLDSLICQANFIKKCHSQLQVDNNNYIFKKENNRMMKMLVKCSSGVSIIFKKLFFQWFFVKYKNIYNIDNPFIFEYAISGSKSSVLNSYHYNEKNIFLDSINDKNNVDSTYIKEYILEKKHEKNIVVFQIDIFNEGISINDINCAMLCVKSISFKDLQQFIGRGQRFDSEDKLLVENIWRKSKELYPHDELSQAKYVKSEINIKNNSFYKKAFYIGSPTYGNIFSKFTVSGVKLNNIDIDSDTRLNEQSLLLKTQMEECLGIIVQVLPDKKSGGQNIRKKENIKKENDNCNEIDNTVTEILSSEKIDNNIEYSVIDTTQIVTGNNINQKPADRLEEIYGVNNNDVNKKPTKKRNIKKSTINDATYLNSMNIKDGLVVENLKSPVDMSLFCDNISENEKSITYGVETLLF